MSDTTDNSDVALSPGTRLRVCHVAYTFYEADNRVMRYAQDVAASGHAVDVIALRRGNQASMGIADGVRIFRIQRRSVTETSAMTYLLKLVWFLVKATTMLTWLHGKHRYDVIHVHNVPDFLVFAAIVPKLTGARIILDIHDIVPELYQGKFGAAGRSRAVAALLKVERASCAFADHVIVANDLWRDTLLARSARQCTTILNYPDTTVFKPVTADQRRQDGRYVLLYPGSLNHHQGVDLAIRAFALSRHEMPDAELHIYGDGPAKPMLTELTRELGLNGRVRILDRVSISEMSAILPAADVGVVPKRADGFGNEAFSTKILEFMASGVPVIVSRTRVDQHHFDPTLVRFFTPGDEHDLAKAMTDVYQNRAETAARAEAAQAFAHRNSWQQHRNVYRRLIGFLTQPSWSRQAALP